MAIQWGGFTSHMRVGLDIWTDGYDTYTPSINVYIAVYAGVDGSWNFNDAQTVTLSGSAGGSWTFQNTMGPNGVQHLGTVTIYGQGQSYGGGPGYSFHGALTGNYLGGTSVVDVGFTLPARPYRAPAPPGAPTFSAITPVSATAAWTGTPDAGGLAVDADAMHLATDSGFGNIFWNSAARGVTGLAPGFTYWARSFAHNGVGWSGPSAVSTLTTTAFPTAAQLTVVPGPDRAVVSWPAQSGLIGYQVQRATDAGFTQNVATVTSATWATSQTMTGLSPGTTYYYRVQAQGGYGHWGAWSGAVSNQTLSGAKVYDAASGAWKNAVANLRVNGAWQLAKVYKRVNGAWQL